MSKFNVQLLNVYGSPIVEKIFLTRRGKQWCVFKASRCIVVVKRVEHVARETPNNYLKVILAYQTP